MDFHDASNYLNNKRNRREVEKNREQIKKLEDENAALTKKINGVVSGSGQIEELWSKISNLEAKLKLLSEEFQILKDPENREFSDKEIMALKARKEARVTEARKQKQLKQEMREKEGNDPQPPRRVYLSELRDQENNVRAEQALKRELEPKDITPPKTSLVPNDENSSRLEELKKLVKDNLGGAETRDSA
jgi:hypothetical protein